MRTRTEHMGGAWGGETIIRIRKLLNRVETPTVDN